MIVDTNKLLEAVSREWSERGATIDANTKSDRLAFEKLTNLEKYELREREIIKDFCELAIKYSCFED